MAFTTCSVATNNISMLEDQPNDVGGLTAAELKAAFDKFGKDFVAWFNETHVAELDGLAGEGHTDETVKGNADALVSHKNESVHQGINSTVSVTSTDNATSTTDAPLKSAGGLAVAKDALINGFIQRDLGNGNYLTQYGHIRYLNSDFKAVEKDKKLVYTFYIGSGTHLLIKVIVGGGQSGSGGNLSMAIEKDFIVDTDYNNNAVVNGTKTGIIHGFDDNDVYIEGTPSDLRVVIEQKKRTTARLIPSIEIRSTNTIITFVNQTIEDI